MWVPTSAAESLLINQMKEKMMFTTDSFLNAEVTYREGRVRRGLTTHRELAAARRAAKGAAKRDDAR